MVESAAAFVVGASFVAMYFLDGEDYRAPPEQSYKLCGQCRGIGRRMDHIILLGDAQSAPKPMPEQSHPLGSDSPDLYTVYYLMRRQRRDVPRGDDPDLISLTTQSLDQLRKYHLHSSDVGGVVVRHKQNALGH